MGSSDPGLLGDVADQFVLDMLKEYGELTRERLSAYLPRAQSDAYLFDLVRDYPLRTGKMLRPSLCIATACAFGATAADAVGSAASIELMHNALLVHDDIEDGSDERRGQPTLHALHGMPLALNAGDALALLSLRPLKENFRRLGPGLALRIFEETERMAWETTEGQALELGWRKDNPLGIDASDYLTMVLKKTCWLTAIHPLRVGCLIGTRGRMPLDPMIRLGFFFGAAFQIQDDLLNLVGGAAYGKEINGDLLEGKRTLILIEAMGRGSSAERARLARFLGLERVRRRPRDIEWLRRLIDRTAALEHARVTARALAGAALYEFEHAFANARPGRDQDFVRALITWVLRRVY